MNLTTLVDVAIGLSLVYLGVSLMVSVLNEYIAQALEWRSRQLASDLKKLVDAPAVQGALQRNPALADFFSSEKGARPGSYVDPKVLAQQLIGGLGVPAKEMLDMKDILGALEKLPDSNLKQNLLALAAVSTNDVTNFVGSVGVWVDQSLTMLGERYKRNAQNLSFVIGLVLAASFNIDTVGMVRHLYLDKEAREAMFALGADVVQNHSKETLDRCSKLNPEQLKADTGCAGFNLLIDGLRQRNDTFGTLPIGWPLKPVAGWPVWLTALAGWLMTALAVSIGASFWFDLLGRLVNVRHGMRKPVPAAESEAARLGAAKPADAA